MSSQSSAPFIIICHTADTRSIQISVRVSSIAIIFDIMYEFSCYFIMDAEGNQYKQSGFSQIKTLHEAFLFNNTLILRRNVPADPPCSNRLSIWRQLLLASSHTKKDSPTTRWNCPRHFPRSALQKSLSESASNRFPVCA